MFYVKGKNSKRKGTLNEKTSKIKKVTRESTLAVRQQIHSGSILVGFIAGSLITIAAITATSKSNLSAKTSKQSFSWRSIGTRISEQSKILII